MLKGGGGCRAVFPKASCTSLSDVALGRKFLFTCKTAHSAKTGLERCYELIFRAAKEIWHKAAISLSWPLDKEVIPPHPMQPNSTSRENLWAGVATRLWVCYWVGADFTAQALLAGFTSWCQQPYSDFSTRLCWIWWQKKYPLKIYWQQVGFLMVFRKVPQRGRLCGCGAFLAQVCWWMRKMHTGTCLYWWRQHCSMFLLWVCWEGIAWSCHNTAWKPQAHKATVPGVLWQGLEIGSEGFSAHPFWGSAHVPLSFCLHGSVQRNMHKFMQLGLKSVFPAECIRPWLFIYLFVGI